MKDEISAPFRGLRFFVYAGMILGGFASSYIAFTRMLATGDTGLEAFKNLGIDLGALVLGAALLKFDLDRREKNLERISKKIESRKKRATSDDEIFVGTPGVGDGE